jgi:chromosome segregation ATPase
MRKVSILVLSILLLLFTGRLYQTVALTEENDAEPTEITTPSVKPTGVKITKTPEQIEQYKATLRTQKQEAIETKKEVYTEAKEQYKEQIEETTANNVQAKAELRFQRILARYEAALARLKKIQTRIETRLVKLQNAGVDTTKAQEYINEGEKSIAEAEQLVLDAKDQFSTMSPDNVLEDYNGVKDLMQEAKLKLVSAKQSFAKAIGVMKGLGTGKEPVSPAVTKKPTSSVSPEPTEPEVEPTEPVVTTPEGV